MVRDRHALQNDLMTIEADPWPGRYEVRSQLDEVGWAKFIMRATLA